METEAAKDLGWWVISGEDLLELLRRAHGGEDPDMIYITQYVNSESVESDDDGD